MGRNGTCTPRSSREYFTCCLCVGFNSLEESYFVTAWFSQWYLRTRHPKWFAKHKYIIVAALDGGTQIMMPMLSFAVEDATGKSHMFLQWWAAFGAMSHETVINGVTHTSRRHGGPETDIPAFMFEKRLHLKPGKSRVAGVNQIKFFRA